MLHSLVRRAGVGPALLDGARAEAARAGCSRLWLITTNDNVEAIRFYQRCGWDWVGFHRDALTESRRLKPGIPADRRRTASRCATSWCSRRPLPVSGAEQQERERHDRGGDQEWDEAEQYVHIPLDERAAAKCDIG